MAVWRAVVAIAFVAVATMAVREGRGAEPKGRVVLYTSVDEPYARPIVREFSKRSGIEVVIQTDTEASKSVGLAERLRAEKANPQADVWWGNEPFHTVALGREGLLEPYKSNAAGDVNSMYLGEKDLWTGVGLRARVIAVHGEGKEGFVKGLSLIDLSEPLLRGKVAMARPTAGTTGGHVAALYSVWGDEKASAYFRKLRENEVKLLGGNGPVAEAVGRGTAQFGLTDNDDVAAAQREGGKVAAGLPDQEEAGMGTLMIPTTVALVKGARNSEGAKKLIDYLVSKEVEGKLIEVKFAGWSVRESKGGPKAMKVDYGKVVEVMPGAVRKATAILEGRE